MAAGKGTRMRSELPKALTLLCGEPMLGYLLQRSGEIGCDRTLVVAGYKQALVREYTGQRAAIVVQKKLLGSGHAVHETAGHLAGFNGPVFVFYCDTPLIRIETIRRLLADYEKGNTDCSLLSVHCRDPRGYGLIKRNAAGSVEKIVEENDATPEEKALTEINVGCYVFSSQKLFKALGQVRKNPKKKEYYLTDVVEILSRTGRVGAVLVEDEEEVLGINTRLELARSEAVMQKRLFEKWVEKGVRFRNPDTITIDADVKIGSETLILPGTVIEEGTVIGKNCVIGPFARIRGKSRIGDGSIVGNFVEIVRSEVGPHTQIKHLSYIGDAKIGSHVNVGAGTITANYDGKKKHTTVIKDGAQIGSGTVLVAPVTVGRSAKTGAGAVVTSRKNVPDRAVVVGVPAKILSTKK